MHQRVTQLSGIDQHRHGARNTGCGGRILVEREAVYIVEVRSNRGHRLVPCLVGGNDHGVVAVLIVIVGPEGVGQKVVVVEDGIEIGDATVDDGTFDTLGNIELTHIIAMDVVADGVDGELTRLERLKDVAQEVDLAIERVDHAIDTGDVGLSHADTLHGVVAGTLELEYLLVEHEDALAERSRSREVAAGDMVLDKLFQQLFVLNGIQGIIVEGSVQRSPDGVGLRSIENLIVACLLQKRCKLRKVIVFGNILPDGRRCRARHGRLCLVMVIPVGAGSCQRSCYDGCHGNQYVFKYHFSFHSRMLNIF